jgi:hypothetical protein
MGSPGTGRARFVVQLAAGDPKIAKVGFAWIGMQQTLNYPGFW